MEALLEWISTFGVVSSRLLRCSTTWDLADPLLLAALFTEIHPACTLSADLKAQQENEEDEEDNQNQNQNRDHNANENDHDDDEHAEGLALKKNIARRGRRAQGAAVKTGSSSGSRRELWVSKYRNLKKVMAEIKSYVAEYLHEEFDAELVPNLVVIARDEPGLEEEVRKLVIVLLSCAIRCEKRELFVKNILTLGSQSQEVLMHEIEKIQQRSQERNVLALKSTEAVQSEKENLVLITSLETLLREYRELETSNNLLIAEYEVVAKQIGVQKKQGGGVRRDSSDSLLSPSRSQNLARLESRRLLEEIEKLSEEMVMLKEENRKKETKISSLTKQVERASKQAGQFQEMRDELDSLSEENLRMKKQAQLAEKYKERLAVLEKAADKAKDLEVQNKKYLETILTMEKKVSNSVTLASQLKSQETTIKLLEEENSRLLQECEERVRENEDLRMASIKAPKRQARPQSVFAMDDFDTSFESHDGVPLSQELASSPQFGEITAKIEALETENASLVEELETVRTERQIYLSRIDQEQSKVKIQESAKEQLAQEIVSLRTEVERAESSNTQLALKLSSAEALTSQISGLQEQLIRAQAKIAEQESELDKTLGLQAELRQKEKLAKELQETERKFHDSRQEVSTLQAQLKTSLAHAGEIEKQAQALQAELNERKRLEKAASESGLTTAEKFKLALESDLNMALVEKSSLLKELQGAQQELGEVQNHLAEMRALKDGLEADLSELQRQNQSLKEGAKASDAGRKEAVSQANQLLQTTAELQRKLEVSEPELRGLRVQLAEAKERLTSLFSQQEESRRLQKHLGDETARATAAEQKVEFLQERIEELDSQLLTLPQTLLQLSAASEQVERYKARLAEHAGRWTQEISSLKESLEAKDLSEMQLHREAVILKGEVSALKSKLSDQTQLVEQVAALKNELDKRKKEARQTVILQEIASIKDQVERDTQSRPDVFQELASLKEALAAKESQDQASRALADEVARLTGELETARASGRTSEALQAELQHVRSQLEAKEKLISKMEDTMGKMREENRVLEDDIGEQEQQCVRLETELVSLRKEMVTVNSQITRREASYAAQMKLANEQIERLQEDLDRFHEESFTWTLQRNAQDSEIGVLKTKLEQAEVFRKEQDERTGEKERITASKIRKLEIDLLESSQEKDRLDGEFSRLESEILALRRENDSLVQKSQNWHQAYLDSDEQVTDLTEHLTLSNETVTTLQQQLSDKARENSTLLQSSKRLERDLELAFRQKMELEKQIQETGNSLLLLESLSAADLSLESPESKAQFAKFHEDLRVKEMRILKLNEDIVRLSHQLHDSDGEVQHLREEYFSLKQHFEELRVLHQFTLADHKSLQASNAKLQQETSKKIEEQTASLKTMEEELKTRGQAAGGRNHEVEGLRAESELQQKLKDILNTQLREEQQRYMKHLQEYQKRIDDIFNEKLALQTEIMKLRENSLLSEAQLKSEISALKRDAILSSPSPKPNGTQPLLSLPPMRKFDIPAEEPAPITPTRRRNLPTPLTMDTMSINSVAKGPDSPKSPLKKRNTLRKIISGVNKSATNIGRSRSIRSTKSSVSTMGPPQPPVAPEREDPEVMRVDHFIDIFDFYEKVAGRTMDNQTFTPKKPEDIPEEASIDDDDDGGSIARMPGSIDGPSTIRKRKSTLKKIGSTLKKTLKSPKKPKDANGGPSNDTHDHMSTEKGSEDGD